MHLCQKGILMKLLIVFGTECFSFSGSYEWYCLSSSYYSTQPNMQLECHTTPLLHTQFKFDTQHAYTATHTKSSVSQSRAVHFVLQVPWHKPSSQEANHIKSMSHVAAYTGSEALSGVMLDIVLYPHTVTHILQPKKKLWGFDSKSQPLTIE